MIATLSGLVRKKLEDRIVLECGGVGYEVLLSPITIAQLEHVTAGRGEKASELELVVYYHATRDQPRPVLIGFTSDLDKEFFEKLITVKDIGPMVAARALAAPVAELAAAIARQDEKYLRGLPGIGPQKAKNIVAQLSAKVAKFRSDQPRPVLIGFTSDLDKEFFEKLITVKDIGPMVAARALAAPVAELAAAIARQDEKYLRGLPGIGPQKAKNIVAQLSAKVAKFALAR